MYINTNKAQTLLEYVILAGMVAAIAVAMGPYFKRGVQAVVKIAADQLANQQNSDQNPASYLVNAFTNRTDEAEKMAHEVTNISKRYTFNEKSTESTDSSTFLGITEKR